MTIEERELCIVAGNQILATDLEKVSANMFPDLELQSVVVGGIELPWLLTTLKRAAKQLVAELKSDNWRFLPNAVNDPDTNLTEARNGTVLLTRQVNYIIRAIEDKDPFENWLPETLFLVRYEMYYGFWERSKTRVHNPEDLNLAKSRTEIDLLAQSLAKSLEETEKTRKVLATNIEELDEFATSKEQQFASLEKTLESAFQSLASVRDSEKEASTSNGKISTLLDQTNKTLDESRKKISQDRKTFEELRGEIASTRKQVSDEFDLLSEHRKEFDNLVVSARTAESHILDQQEEIMRLIGHAADGRLATAFNDREKALSSSVMWWRWASLAAVFVAIGWIIFIFYKNPSQDGISINWLILLANVIRTSPAFLLVFFCQSQYTKERNIQEEYAFKAAVSRTVTAYADMIGTGEINERVRMLMETIQRIYIPPVLGKPMKPISFRTKDLAEAAKSLAETTQNMKSAVTDFLKSSKSTPNT
ncbi:hypothetical protein MUN81_15550 [Hymenobacter sp. 5317J-9]|uniref:hypothetical protein n=1 Tax=Hymenobacter sp. 5317J-9 TaxID=2932250 RepID=UPI001FD6A28F|nr:hypothetical protein [Hymenobacter sp. 5317J-9]UOQ96651.1 hypothetical protein MUN81_15550 [Hymenobacter sp. 5317J-9]